MIPTLNATISHQILHHQPVYVKDIYTGCISNILNVCNVLDCDPTHYHNYMVCTEDGTSLIPMSDALEMLQSRSDDFLQEYEIEDDLER